ncbi:carbohydrate kinase family protein [Pseudanabaena sp. PCC 6802]|uniref:carbohydrate kinase family protein n=1 Tax=Pseudanabaena sp. PCC 6802 TaxID=118173 RepID=UPI00034CE84B|nr:carbohydrate kinase [Pseudanabaena sp. PCC 6802]
MPHVLCLGEILIDQIATETGSFEQVKSWNAYPGGAPANVACGLTKLGTSSGFIGCVGQDAVGNHLVQLLQSTGVDTSGVQVHATAPTRQVYVTRSDSGERTFAKFSSNESDRAETAFADMFLDADRLPEDLFIEADFLVLGTLCLASPIAAKAVERALQLAEKYYLGVVVDINWRPMFWPDPSQALSQILSLLAHVDYLKVSVEEAEWLFQTSNPVAISALHDHLEGVIVTNGEMGCQFYLGEREGSHPAFPVATQDTTGAGDSFLAGFVHQLCHHPLSHLDDPALVREIITYASAVGAITTTGLGAIAPQPTDAEVRDFLLQRS